jgi:hypothetical protein
MMCSRSSMKTVGVLAVLIAAASCAKSRPPSPGVGTNTNWLKTCTTASDCGDLPECVCGLCTRTCSAAKPCDGLGESASCEQPGASLCGEQVSLSVCLEGCKIDDDCSSVRGGTCASGLCVAQALPADASTPSDAAVAGGPLPDASTAIADAGAADDCYSPTQNSEHAYETGAVGCACDRRDAAICVGGAALICDPIETGASRLVWSAVEDGPCYPRADTTCANGTLRASATDCLSEFSDCYQLPSGEFCGTPSCTPQDAWFEPGDPRCTPVQRFYWDGLSCAGRGSCSPAPAPCKGRDCDRGFATMDECVAAYAVCQGVNGACGGLADFCMDDGHFCAYMASGDCGSGDVAASCQQRPLDCNILSEGDPVCACDGKTYPNVCEANLAGFGIREYAPCIE